MPEPPDNAGLPPSPPSRLHRVGGPIKWMRVVAAAGLALLGLAVALAFFAPSPQWFLLYPLLILGGLAALATAAAWLLRYF